MNNQAWSIRKINNTERSYRRQRLKNTLVDSNESLTKAFRHLAPSFAEIVMRSNGGVETPIEKKRIRPGKAFRTEAQDCENLQAILSEQTDLNFRGSHTRSNTRLYNLQDSKNATQRDHAKCQKCGLLREISGKYKQLKSSYQRLRLQNVKLQKENELISEALRSIELKGGTPENIMQTMKAQSQIENLQEQLSQKTATSVKHLKLLNNMSLKCEFFQKELQAKDNQLVLANRSIRFYESSSEMSEVEKRRLHEIALMSHEEMLSQQTEILHLRKVLKKMKDEKSRQDQHLKRIEMENRTTYKLKKSNFDYQLQIFKTLTNTLSSVRQGITSLNGTNSNWPKDNKSTGEQYSKFMDTTSSLTNQEAVYKFVEHENRYELDLSIFNLGRPTFFCFVAHEYELLGYEKSSFHRAHSFVKLSERKSQTLSFVRSIFDSMYRCFQLEHIKEVPAFPEFVFTWIEGFTVAGGQKKIIRELKDSATASKHRFQFYAAIMNQAFNDNWEIVAFRQFLLETSSIEELYAYLKLRHFLFKGSLSDRPQAHYDYVIQVEFTQIDTLLNHFVPCDKVNLSYLKNLLKGSSTFIKGRRFLDSGFLLRSCLEYYRASRVESFNTLTKKLKEVEQKKEETPFHTFQQFNIIVNANYSGLSSAERVAVFRRFFAFGEGNISAEILFAALSEQRIFLKQLMKDLDERWNKAMALPLSRQLANASSLLTRGISADSYFKKYVAGLGIDRISNLVEAPFATITPALLLTRLDFLSTLMRHSLAEMVISSKFQFQTIESTFKFLVEQLCTAYQQTLARKERIEAKEEAIAIQLVHSLEHLMLSQIEESNLNLIQKFTENSQLIGVRRGSSRRPIKKNAPKSQQPLLVEIAPDDSQQ